jgi:hypothetical protein
LSKNIFLFCALVGCKCATEEKSKPSDKHTATNSEMKIRMIHNNEGGQNLSAIACGISCEHLHERRSSKKKTPWPESARKLY